MAKQPAPERVADALRRTGISPAALADLLRWEQAAGSVYFFDVAEAAPTAGPPPVVPPTGPHGLPTMHVRRRSDGEPCWINASDWHAQLYARADAVSLALGLYPVPPDEAAAVLDARAPIAVVLDADGKRWWLTVPLPARELRVVVEAPPRRRAKKARTHAEASAVAREVRDAYKKRVANGEDAAAVKRDLASAYRLSVNRVNTILRERRRPSAFRA